MHPFRRFRGELRAPRTPQYNVLARVGQGTEEGKQTNEIYISTECLCGTAYAGWLDDWYWLCDFVGDKLGLTTSMLSTNIHRRADELILFLKRSV